jgi:prepilin-type N-terminal cleavage/methylation domain-containing protein
MHGKVIERPGERGMSMVEVLVALAILVIAGLVALMLYDASRKSFKRGENVTEQQQAVRIAFDKLNSDLRMAGFNTNPDGVDRPDEQIEAAFDTAVIVRADYDAEDPAASLTPETALATGGAFRAVSTGNDEVVLYALARPNGTGPNSLQFNADMRESPRNGTLETITINNLVLVQNPANAPYTLYRITFSTNPAAWGTSGFVTRTPLVENVRAMRFKYYDLAGNQINSVFDLASTTDDIGGSEAPVSVAQRASVRRVEIELEGLTREPDLSYTDPEDPNAATRSLRKFSLTADVTPRNLGLKGIQDLNSDLVPPGKPATPTLGTGHCGGLLVNWSPNPVDDEVAYYTVAWGTAPGSYTSGSLTTTGTFAYVGGLTNGTAYYVAIEAVDAAGNPSIKSDPAGATPTNTTTPNAPTALAARETAPGEMTLSWAAVTRNTTNTAGDPETPKVRDLAGYRVYRGTSSGFTPSVSNRRADEAELGPMSTPSWIDTGMVTCRAYAWKVTAVDTCGVESGPSAAVTESVESDVDPRAPVNVAAYVLSPTQNRITWDPVTRNEENQAISIDTYRVYRSDPVDIDYGGDPRALEYSLVGTDTASDNQYVDYIPGTTSVGKKFYYYVTAVDDCPNESEPSAPDDAFCAFQGDVAFTTPQDGQLVSGVVTVTVRVDNGSGLYAHLRVDGDHQAGTGDVLYDADVTGGGPWTFTWVPPRSGQWVLTAVVTNLTGCNAATSITVQVNPTVGCCLAPRPATTPLTLKCRTTSPSNTQCTDVSYFMVNNNCLTTASVESMQVTWAHTIPGVPTPRLREVWFDKAYSGHTATIIWNAAGLLSPADNTFGGVPPNIPVSRNASDPLKISYIFDQVMSKKVSGVFQQNTLTSTWNFRLLDEQGSPTDITGTCGPAQGIFHDMIVEPHN